jgi:hypothetical protein
VTVLFTRTFTAADGAAVETAEPTLVGSGGTISANRARTTSSTITYYDTTDPGSADYECSAEIYQNNTPSGSGGAGPIVRKDTAADTFYAARYNSSGWQLIRVVGGTTTQMGSTVGTDLLTNGTSKVLTVRAEGSSISAYLDGVLIIGPITNTAITAAGKAGFRINSTQLNLRLDNLALNTLVAAATTKQRRTLGLLGTRTGSRQAA